MMTAVETTYEGGQVLQASFEYFKGDELAATTWINKYCLKDPEGKYLEKTPDDMHRRMAGEFARVERSYDQTEQSQLKRMSDYGQSRESLDEETIYSMFREFRYVIPQGSVMAMLGNPFVIGSLSNCVVVHSPVDSYGGIFKVDQQIAQLCKRRCGVGFDISSLRPAGMGVANSAGTTSGAISFMERFSNTTREVGQKGRRGALMLTMDISHPDIERFVTIKQDLSRVTGANVSVRVSDEFMNAVKKDSPFILRWPIDSDEPELIRTVKARELWDLVISSAHLSAEPGILYWDRHHHYSTSSVYPGYANESTNPCSEIAMQGGDSCRLMALNLYGFVNHPFTAEAEFNFDEFYKVTYESQRLMDDLVDLELESIERILKKLDEDPEEDAVKKVEVETWEMLYNTGKEGRRTGLGFTALADTIAAMGHAFDSEESLKIIEAIMKVKCLAEFDSSIDMAIERGSFQGFDPEIEESSAFIGNFSKEFPEVTDRMMRNGRRNISISTVAPTGSVSLLAQTSSGIEPVFMTSYKRRRKVDPEKQGAKVAFKDDSGDSWEEFDVYHPGLKKWMELNPENDLDDNPYAGSTAPEIDWEQRIRIQAVVQKYVTHSISSTINLPSDTSPERVSEIYMSAWEKGLKGITVYRDGSRTGVLVSGENDSKESSGSPEFLETMAPKRPKVIEARVIRFMNDDEKWLAFVGVLNGRPYEIFTGRAEEAFAIPGYVESGWIIKSRSSNGRSRYDFRYVDRQGFNVTIEGLSRSFNKEFWNYGKLLSGILRHGMPIHYVADLVANLHFDNDYINSWKNGVARSLQKFIPNGTKLSDHECPSCGDESGLIFEEGCLKCRSCSYTKCG